MIRLAKESDLPDLVVAVKSASIELLELYGTPDTSEQILRGMAYGIEKHQAVVVATDAEIAPIIGFVAWVWFDDVSSPGAVEGLGTWVHPWFRKLGIGGDMRKLARATALAAGRRYVTGVVAHGNESGRKAAESLGMSCVGYLMRGVL